MKLPQHVASIISHLILSPRYHKIERESDRVSKQSEAIACELRRIASSDNPIEELMKYIDRYRRERDAQQKKGGDGLDR